MEFFFFGNIFLLKAALVPLSNCILNIKFWPIWSIFRGRCDLNIFIMVFSDRCALFVVGTIAQAFCHSLQELALFRSIIRRARCQNREALATVDKATFIPNDPLLLHWNGKAAP